MCNGDGPDLGLNWIDCKFKLWKWLEPKVLRIQKISLKIGPKVLLKKQRVQTETRGSFWNEKLKDIGFNLSQGCKIIRPWWMMLFSA
jgi:hypothetical protein